jgi:hypothetical protein
VKPFEVPSMSMSGRKTRREKGSSGRSASRGGGVGDNEIVGAGAGGSVQPIQ